MAGNASGIAPKLYQRARDALASEIAAGALAADARLTESGVAARFLGPVGAAIFGGIGSIALTGVWARLFPALRAAHLDTVRTEMPAKGASG